MTSYKAHPTNFPEKSWNEYRVIISNDSSMHWGLNIELLWWDVFAISSPDSSLIGLRRSNNTTRHSNDIMSARLESEALNSGSRSRSSHVPRSVHVIIENSELVNWRIMTHRPRIKTEKLLRNVIFNYFNYQYNTTQQISRNKWNFQILELNATLKSADS